MEKANITIFSPDDIYSYGAMTIAGILENEGYKTQLSRKLTLSEAQNSNFVGFSLSSTLHLTGKIKSLISNLKNSGKFIVIGGPISITPEFIFNCIPEVDVVVVGEGEETILDLVDTWLNSRDLENVDGIAFKNNSKMVITKQREPADISEKPLPKIPEDIGSQSIRGASLYIETHRGCAANCSFCLIPKLFGTKIRTRLLNSLITEVRSFRKAGAKKIAIGTGNVALYGCKKGVKIEEEKVIKMLKAVSKVTGPQNLAAPDLRIDMIPDSLVKAILKYTYGLIIFGLESGSNKILRKMRKGITVEKIKETINRVRKFNGKLKVDGAFIVGYPGESEEDFNMTKELVEELNLSDYTVSIAEPIPGTELCYEILKLPVEKNSVFAKDKTRLGKKNDLSIAERRAFELILTAALSRTLPIYVDDRLTSEYLKFSQKQGEEIRNMTKIILEKYPKNYK
ncbi:MAG: methyl-coenzyme M reductase glutamine C-methyltransferase [Candidatus Hodarchaeota archaeon]